MKIDPDILRKCEERTPTETGARTHPAAASGTARTRRAGNLAFAGSRPSPTEFERVLGTNDLVDEFYLERALVAARPVCRLVLRSDSGREIGWATGFLVSPRMLLTNWHVFRTAVEAHNAVAEFDYKLDIQGNPVTPVRFRIRPDRFYASDRELDYALVAVEETSIDGRGRLTQFGYHRLIREPGKVLQGEWITIIQHPGGQRRQFAIRENELIAMEDQFLWYQSDTAPGSSGAPAFNDSFQIVALHHAGKARQENGLYVLRDGRKVSSIDDVDESDVVWEKNEGLRVSVLCADMDQRLPASDPYVQELRRAMERDEGHVMARAIAGIPAEIAVRTNGDGPLPIEPDGGGTPIPLQVHVSVSYGAPRSRNGAKPPLVAVAAVPIRCEADEVPELLNDGSTTSKIVSESKNGRSRGEALRMAEVRGNRTHRPGG